MELLIIAVLCIVFELGTARNIAYYAVAPNLPDYPLSYRTHSSSLVTPSQRQFHTQDDLGQYAYGYQEPLSSKQEVRSLDGVTRGAYSYRDADGKLQTVAYTADADGFRVAATNLPRGPLPANLLQSTITPNIPTNTAGIIAARAAHLADLHTPVLRLAKHDAASHKSNSVDANYHGVQLRQSLENSVAVDGVVARASAGGSESAGLVSAGSDTSSTVATVATDQLRSSSQQNAHLSTTWPLAYQTAVIPDANKFGYPLNSRFLAIVI